MEKESCCVCFKPKATLECSLCKSAVCKYCAQFIEEDQFSFLPIIPEDLKHTTYCGPCFNAKVDPQIRDYNETMEKAKAISVYFITDSKKTRNFKRLEKPLKVVESIDRDDVLMRLAFLAVKGNFNAIIDVDILAEKVRSGTYQTTKYSGTAIPIQLNSERFK